MRRRGDVAAVEALQLVELLAEAGCAELDDILSASSTAEWLEVFVTGRPAFLAMLRQAGVTKLPQRQAIANVVGKCRREGRI